MGHTANPRSFQQPSLLQRLLPLLRGFDGPLIAILLALSGIGLVAMYSAGFDHGTRFFDHGRNLLLAAAILFIVAQVPPQRLMSLAPALYALGVALLVAVALFGITKKGAQRWINIGVVIQPSELLKIAMPLMLAWWFQKREGQLRAPDFLAAAALLALPVGLIMKQPDLGTALLVLASGGAIIFFAGLPWKLVLPPVLLGGLGIALIVWYEPQLCAEGVRWPVLHNYQQQRICTLLDPTRDPLGKGFHIIQGMIAIGSGGLWGKGFMSGTQTHLEFIPERTTDFIFAAYSEEFGMAGNLLLILCYLLLVWRGLAIANQAATLFGRLMAAGVAMIFFAYAFVNMGMVSGILPVVGVPLPFISYGGTAMTTLGLALGVLMSIARAQHALDGQALRPGTA
ncbi:rod shape-determining protein RodA [Melaminivora sp.]